ncbi:hypothetical protein B0F90DRAFT_1811552 [Multifurca ochricompacta]|uniref:C2H2-type domain-containing protein n=1 Tax=Multifurca ochricompacta TaxID=376703 RepID=A0AAD4LYU1_9AGAM|nr:hypothetical protein B0F90DRAFT_1811552 [Multifurca ochricompacta]
MWNSHSRLPCLYSGCPVTFKSQHGRTYHIRSIHANSNAHSDTGPRQDPSSVTPLHQNGLDYQDVPPYSSSGPSRKRIEHAHLTAVPCDLDGNFLPPGSTRQERTQRSNADWSPFDDRTQFMIADLLYRRVEMSASNIDLLMKLWLASLEDSGLDTSEPFECHQDLYAKIDSSPLGDVPWQCFITGFSEDLHMPVDAPSWKQTSYEVWYRDPDLAISAMLDNPDFEGHFDVRPYMELDEHGQRCWGDIMSANVSWKHCDEIFASNADAFGAMYCPIILGCDKTTVSVATGHVEYHPLYLSIGNIHNTVRCVHHNAIVPIAFLAIPKSDRRYDDDPEFRKFKRQLYHASLSTILRTLLPGMTKPAIRQCPDGHYRRIIYDLITFIADYPEQVMLTGIVQGWCPKCITFPIFSDNLEMPTIPRTRALTEELADFLDSKTLWNQYGIDDDIIPFTNDFPRADIHAMLSPDLLHQVIKGMFKDHLVTWVGEYLLREHGESKSRKILDEIDRRIAAVPAFSGLRRFPQGRRFKQWTGDDTKALMKVYLPSIVGFVPNEMVTCIATSLDVYYLVHRQNINEDSLKNLDLALIKFIDLREIFHVTGVRTAGFSLPRQHALVHYHSLIEHFGAPGGLCSSITESRHISAVKKPWRRSNRYHALGQMLMTNQCLDKLSAMHSDFVARGMLPAGHIPPQNISYIYQPNNDTSREDDDESNDENGGAVDEKNVLGHVVLARSPARRYPQSLEELSNVVNEPNLPYLTQIFLVDQLHLNDTSLPPITSKISVFHSAVATFFAPSDPSGIYGMRRERIHSTPSWQGKGPRCDCAFVVEDEAKPGMQGLNIVRVQLMFSFKYNNVEYPCSLVDWFTRVSTDNTTGIQRKAVVHLDAFLQAAHLILVYGSNPLPLHRLTDSYSLDTFKFFYVNKYIDHHAHEIAF